MDRFAYDQRLRLYANRKFDIVHGLPPQVADFLELEGMFHVLERTSFHFVEGYLNAKIATVFDWSVVDSMDRVPYKWEPAEVHTIHAYECVRSKNRQDASIVHEKVVVFAVLGRFNCADAEAAYRYHRCSLESTAPSWQSPPATLTASGSDDVYGGNVDGDWEVDPDNGSAVMIGRSKKLRFKFYRYRH